MLAVKDIHTFYGKSHILHGVTLELREGEMVCLLGRNGVGKSTTMKSIMGLLHPSQGSIQFEGREILGKPPYEIARLGVCSLPEFHHRGFILCPHSQCAIGLGGPGKTRQRHLI
jgi:branched-chain amino acid transport system ATP-binding protein